ncbi:nucleotidyltransferase domain-containing protein [Cycloclasticus pugetii]|uniref:nucleotidyltransferase domain-containing protein n=1 Tax=Cycloclasticus pugetii TaxID=34068 RepID=UPI000378C95C|nr:nucleotidyltransferase domain-containing protein [Cycloclasticus pugetii]
MSYLVLRCGSQARGDANPNSDHDFVCLHDENQTPIKLIKERYQQITFLSIDAIGRMKDKGALFITHLDTDGVIVEGEEKLIDLIRGYRPSVISLKKTLKETKMFAKSIEWLPCSSEGKFWFYDVIYVALRNILYCENAMRSSYCFGYTDAALAFGMSNREVDIMLQIRSGKYMYRREEYSDEVSLSGSIDSVFELVNNIIGQNLSFQIGGLTDWHGKWSYNYWDERIVERAIINDEIPDDGFRKMLKDHNYNRRVLVDELKDRIKTAQQAPPAGATKTHDTEA